MTPTRTPEPVSTPKESKAKATPVAKANKDGFSCEPKKTCGQMSSCAEAKFQLKNSGNTSIDGDGEGKPCASICK